MYQALYRKWRPRTFDDVVGQAHITETLKRQVAAGRLSHAYLFTGTRGTGKTSCAKILARAVNCEHPVDGNPCNQCPSCLGIENGSILDVLELDAASNNGVDQVRALRDEAVYTPAAVQKRVYIIDEVHMLSTAAFNALLKILEEPPAHLMFILATTELHKVPATIKSRCQQFAFKRILPGDIARRLGFVAAEEGIALSPEGAALLARLADGGLRDALSLLDQCVNPTGIVGEREVLDALGLAGNLETGALMEQLADGDTASALETLGRLYGAGKDVGSLLNELAGLTRDLLLRKMAPKGGAALLTGGYDETTMRRLSNQMEPQRLMQMLGLLQGTIAELSRSGNRRIDAELCLIRLSDVRLDSSPAGLNARLARLEQRLASGDSLVPSRLEGTQAAPTVDTQPQVAECVPSKPIPEKESEERPPWEEEERPPLPEEPGEPLGPDGPGFVSDAPVQEKKCAPKPDTSLPQDSESVGATGNVWPGLVTALRGRVPMSEYPFLSNPAMVQGRLEGDRLTLWVDSDFTRNMVGKTTTLDAVRQTAGEVLGRTVRCTVSVGQAPSISAAGPGAEHDNLDDLVALGQQFDSIIVT